MRSSFLIAVLVLHVSLRAQEEAPFPWVVGELPAASRQSLEDKRARPHVFADPDWFTWGGSCVRDEEGTYHLFYSRWPRDNGRGMRGWLYVSEIARATSDRPEGPYVHQETVLRGDPAADPERWDAFNAHNPCVVRVREQGGKTRYALYFIANRDDGGMENDWWDHVIRQRIGVALADSPEGPWTRHDRPVIEPPAGPLHHYQVNPGVCQLPDGRFLMVLKARAEGTGRGRGRVGPMVHGWALAHRPEGPFVAQDTLLFPDAIAAEDPCVWVQGTSVYAVVKDWRGGISGEPGLSAIRGELNGNGGITWTIPKAPRVSSRVLHFQGGDVVPVRHLERPFVLQDESGRPTHLFAAASVLDPFQRATFDERSEGPRPDVRNLPVNVCLPLIAR